MATRSALADESLHACNVVTLSLPLGPQPLQPLSHRLSNGVCHGLAGQTRQFPRQPIRFVRLDA